MLTVGNPGFLLTRVVLLWLYWDAFTSMVIDVVQGGLRGGTSQGVGGAHFWRESAPVWSPSQYCTAKVCLTLLAQLSWFCSSVSFLHSMYTFLQILLLSICTRWRQNATVPSLFCMRLASSTYPQMQLPVDVYYRLPERICRLGFALSQLPLKNRIWTTQVLHSLVVYSINLSFSLNGHSRPLHCRVINTNMYSNQCMPPIIQNCSQGQTRFIFVTTLPFTAQKWMHISKNWITVFI